ncbi:MAG: alternative ribosome rescue aminoacyl-tRNA hydrolase ArfB [Rectinemataceae bacterium]
MNLDLLSSSIKEKAELDFARSGGPGGQNVNKVNSKAIARIRLDEVLGLSAAEAAMAAERLAGRLTTTGELVIQSDEERDQGRNREAALARLFSIIAAAARLPKIRKATKPTRGSRERRLASKRVRSASKDRRRKPSEE